MQLAKSFSSIHSFVVGVELVYEEAFPGLPHLGVLAVDLFHHSYPHVREAVAWQVEVVPCCLI